VDLAGFYARDNAKDHQTDQFELVQDPTPTPVFRRGLAFFFAVRFDRQFDPVSDVIRLQFGFGEYHPNSDVPVSSSGRNI
jgi:transglutaminase 1